MLKWLVGRKRLLVDLSKLSDSQLALLAKTHTHGLANLSDQELHDLKLVVTPEIDTKKALLAGVDVAGRALDLPGGLVRTGAGQLAEAVTGKELVSPDDWKQALLGRAPTTSTMLERGGVGELGSVDMPTYLGGRYTGRGTLGFLGDVASGVAAGAGLGSLAAREGGGLLATGARVLNAPNEAVGALASKAGKAMYRGAYKNLDRAAALAGKGKTAISDILAKNKWWGGSQATEDFTRNLSNKLNQQVEDLVAKNTIEGGTVDVADRLKLMKIEAQKLLADQHSSSIHGQVKDYIKQLDYIIAQGEHAPKPVMPQQLAPGIEQVNGGLFSKAEGRFVPESEGLLAETLPAQPRPFSTQAAREVSQDLYKMIGPNEYGLLSSSSKGNKLMKGAVHSIKTGIEGQVPEVAALNAENSALIAAKKKIAQEATQAVKQNAATTVGFMSLRDPALAALKHLGDISKMKAVRAGGGLLLQTPLANNALTQSAIEASGRGNTDDNLAAVIERIKAKYGQ